MTTTPTQAPGAVAPTEASLQVQTTILEDQPTEEQLQARGFTTRCEFETDFPSNLLSGTMFVSVSEADEPFQTTQIIESNETWLIDLVWFLRGQVVPLISGREWRVKIFMESLGRDSLDLEIPLRVPTNPNHFYHVQLRVPPNFVRPEPFNGTPYEINVVTVLLANNGRTSPIIGFCSLDPILFFAEEIEVSP